MGGAWGRIEFRIGFREGRVTPDDPGRVIQRQFSAFLRAVTDGGEHPPFIDGQKNDLIVAHKLVLDGPAELAFIIHRSQLGQMIIRAALAHRRCEMSQSCGGVSWRPHGRANAGAVVLVLQRGARDPMWPVTEDQIEFAKVAVPLRAG